MCRTSYCMNKVTYSNKITPSCMSLSGIKWKWITNNNVTLLPFFHFNAFLLTDRPENHLQLSPQDEKKMSDAYFCLKQTAHVVRMESMSERFDCTCHGTWPLTMKMLRRVKFPSVTAVAHTHIPSVGDLVSSYQVDVK